MGATLDALHRLQEIELQLAEIRSGIERKARAVTRQQARIAEIDAKILAQQASIRQAQMEADRFDLEVKSHEVEIAKLRQALNTSKTNKEYSAILTQLNTSKADNSKIEERVLAALTQVDTRKKELEDLQATHAAESEKLAAFQNEVRAAEAKNSDRLARLMAQREEAAKAVPSGALQVFTRVAGKNEGQAMAHVVRTNPKRAEFACGGCNMAINIQQVNAIMSRDEAVLCNICGKILYLDEPATAAAR